MLLFVLAAVAVIVAVRWLAERTGLPAAALLTLVGIGYALLPGPNVALDPHLVLTLVLPPLLYSAALDSSLTGHPPQPADRGQPLGAARAGHRRADRRRLLPARRRAPRWRPASRSAPPSRRPDPVAALAVGPQGRPAAAADHPHPGRGPAQRRHRADHPDRRRGRRAAATASPRPGALGQFAARRGRAASRSASRSPTASGRCAGCAATRCRRTRSRWPRPFAAYLLGEELHVSGVLAVVVAGLIIGHHSPELGVRRQPAADRRRLAAGRLPARGLRLPADRPAAARRDQRPRAVRDVARRHRRRRSPSACVLLLRPLWLLLTESPAPVAAHPARQARPATTAEGVRRELRTGSTRPRGRRPELGRHPRRHQPGGDLHPAAGHRQRRAVPRPRPAAVLHLPRRAGHPGRPGAHLRAAGPRSSACAPTRPTRPGCATRPGSAAVEAGARPPRRAGRPSSTTTSTTRRSTRIRGAAARPAGPLPPPAGPARERRGRRDPAVTAVRGGAAACGGRCIDAQREELLRWRDVGRLPDEGLRVLERELDHEEGLLPDRARRGEPFSPSGEPPGPSIRSIVGLSGSPAVSRYSSSRMVALAWPPPSHIVCRP